MLFHRDYGASIAISPQASVAIDALRGISPTTFYPSFWTALHKTAYRWPGGYFVEVTVTNECSDDQGRTINLPEFGFRVLQPHVISPNTLPPSQVMYIAAIPGATEYTTHS